MDAIRDILRSFVPVGGETLSVVRAETQPFAAVDPRRLRIEVGSGGSAQVVVLHDAPDRSQLSVVLAAGARIELVEFFAAGAFAEVSVRQAADSRCRFTTVQLAGADAACTVDLDGRGAESVFHGVFLASGKEHCSLALRTNHNVADCRSDALVKGVAGGEAVGEFRGLVYVAPDAQRTDAQQQSRNILLGERARIVTRPQLEIYADDVKCAHGATVGQMDAEAILYMRQRGLSEAQARSLQIEGFVGDAVGRCGIDALREGLMAAVGEKLQKL